MRQNAIAVQVFVAVHKAGARDFHVLADGTPAPILLYHAMPDERLMRG
jgi:hypothetical protein